LNNIQLLILVPLLKDIDRLKQAIILKEVLDTPRALKRSIR